MWSALADLKALPGPLVESIGFIGGETLRGNMEVLLRNLPALSDFFPVSGEKIRRLVGIADREKPRTVAILDYWSQTVLRPVHLFLFTVLRRIPQDVTFDQGSFVEKVLAWESIEYFSFDLKDATDRFPVDFIGRVLEGAFTQEWVRHWLRLMVGFPFSTEHGEVSYRVGNPMGAYSSWASFAVAHHFVMYDSCRELRTPWRTSKYVVLGDDVLVGDAALAWAYRSRLESLGVEVSVEKTLISQRGFEFAKRYFLDGREVTPFPVSAVVDTWRMIPLLVSALYGERRRSLVPQSGIPGAVRSLYDRLHQSSKLSRRAECEAARCVLGLEYASGSLGAIEFLSGLIGPQSAGLRASGVLNEGVATSIISSAVHAMFADSLSNPKLDLGRLAVDLVERFTGRDDRFQDDGFSLIYALPFLGCYGQVEEQYMRALRDHQLGLIGEDSGSVIRALMIPLSDRAFNVPDRVQGVVLQGKFAATVLKVARDQLGPLGGGGA